MKPPQQDVAPDREHTRKPFFRIPWLIGCLGIMTICAIALLATFVLVRQGVSQGLVTLTIISIVGSMIIGVLTLMVNFFQWHVSTSQTTQLPLANPSQSVQPPTITLQDIASPPPAPITSLLHNKTPITTRPLVTLAEQEHAHRVDWGDAPTVEHFYGREQLLGELKHWITSDRCQVVALLGIGGVGKTTLATTLTRQISQEFECVFWRSLQNVPSLENILEKSILFLSNQQHIDLPQESDALIAILIEYLRKQRCLLVLDNFESVLQSGKRAGYYCDGHEGFGRLLEAVGGAQHQSCLLLTSREMPHEVSHLEGKLHPVRSLQLPGVDLAEGQRILKDEGIADSDEVCTKLITLYAGNPLSLKLIAEPIRELFRGDIAAFLAQKETIVGDIRALLDQQFERLPALEQETMYWLAIERETVSLEDLRKDIAHMVPKGALLEALKSLRRRSLIETSGTGAFMLQPVILEYVTDKLVEQGFKEIESGTIGIVQSYAFIKAQAKDYTKGSQARFILQPLVDYLLTAFGKEESEKKLRQMLLLLQQTLAGLPGYAAGNILNLLLQLGVDLRGYDFSHLTVWQADLQTALLPEVNFANADMAKSVFAENFGNILSVTVGAVGKLLGAGTTTGDIEIWQLPDITPLLTCQGHTDWVRSVAFSPDGTMLVSGSDDQTVRLWQAQTGQCLKILQEQQGKVYTVAFSPNGTLLASGGDDQVIRIWETNTGQCLHTLQGHSSRVRSLAFAPGGNIIASGSEDCSVKLWAITTGHCLNTLHGHADRIYSVAFSADGRFVVSGSDDQSVRVWEVSSGQIIKTLTGHRGRVQSVACSPDGMNVVSGGEDRSIRVWEMSTGWCLHTLQGHSNRVRSLAFSADGTTIVSGSEDRTIRLWEMRTGQCYKTLRGHNDWVYSIAFSPDGTLLANDSDLYVRLREVSTGRCLKMLGGQSSWVYSLTFSPDGATLASGSDDQSVRLWQVNTAQPLKTLRGHSGRVRSVAFSPDGKTLASGADDQSVRLWQVSTGQCLSVLKEHTDRVRSVAFSPDGKTLASGADDQSVRLWQVSTGQCLKTLQEHNGRIWSVAFNSENSILASGGDDHLIRLWESCTDKSSKTLHGHNGRIYALAFNADGSRMASGSEDRTVRLWDGRTGEYITTLQGHTSRVRSVAFSPEGHILASCSHDGTIKLWDVLRGTCLQTLRSDLPYERMNISGVRGITEAQKATLKALGAIEL